MNDHDEREQTKPQIPWLEWVASGVGLLLAVASLGYIVWDGLTSDAGPPSVHVNVI